MVRNTAIAELPSRYDVLVEQRMKRKLALQKAQETAEATRSAMVSHINSVASGQVQLGEQLLRGRSGVNKRA